VLDHRALLKVRPFTAKAGGSSTVVIHVKCDVVPRRVASKTYVCAGVDQGTAPLVNASALNSVADGDGLNHLS
jgi:hypothetical protein